MISTVLILMSSVVGQYYYPPGYSSPGYGYGYGYGYRTPLNVYDPMRYNRFYSGEGYYTYAPTAIANPEVINLKKPAPAAAPTTSAAGTTGLVLAVDEAKKQIKVQLPTGTISVAYGPTTHFLASDGNFPVIKPGNLINVNQNTITILRRSQQ